ncbi:hypothetical protein BDW02DRAFT_622468 [Decorospora gaudefroyi]|uniref:Uncharacterized protein n=1 Tax=Decorospora gaudefroyi TaxID=184978 RepID=A0A6A5KCL8_9PLEO|nr:hypothetical protein BDW02DRAFT_622468 [Decorospora gaudefroyi]
MDVDMPSPKGKNKRTAEDVSPNFAEPDSSSTISSNMPYLICLRQHRRRNVAAEEWGPEVLAIPEPEDPNAPFNVYKSLLRHPNLFFQFAVRLPYASIIDLYAIDKEFHYRLNKYSVSLIHDYTRYHAPLASHIFSWVLHPDLCISDPMLRPMDGREWLARDVPGFRWVGMVLQRQKVVKGILTTLALEGLRVPASCEASLMKFWGVMEVSEIKLRRAFLRDRDIWADQDLLNLCLFHVKLDMRFSDPVLGNGVCELSRMLLGQKGLVLLWKVLTGEVRMDYDEGIRGLVRTYPMDELDFERLEWLDDPEDNGVPEEEWGLLAFEDWDEDGERMEMAFDMLVTEAVRRGLHVQQYLLDFVLYGFVDGEGRNVPVPRLLRKDCEVVVPREGWPAKGVRDAVIKGLDGRFGVGRG